MRKMKKIISLTLVICLLFVMSINVFANEAGYSIEEINQFLLDSGMTQAELDELDIETRRLIIENSGTELEYVPLSATPQIIRAGDAPISFTCPAYRVTVNGGYGYVYDVYPTYESTAKIKPKGNDSFAFVVGDGLRVDSGFVDATLYVREETTHSWQSDSLSISSTSLYGNAFSGAQMGSPDFPIYFKGQFYFRAEPYSSEPDLRVNLKYIYDTTGNIGYAIGLTAGAISVSYSSNVPVGSVLEKSRNYYMEE